MLTVEDRRGGRQQKQVGFTDKERAIGHALFCQTTEDSLFGEMTPNRSSRPTVLKPFTYRRRCARKLGSTAVAARDVSNAVRTGYEIKCLKT